MGFGSEAKPSQDELTKVALGLEKSKLHFFWVFRTRRGLKDPDQIELPKGFEEPTKGCGRCGPLGHHNWKYWDMTL